MAMLLATDWAAPDDFTGRTAISVDHPSYRENLRARGKRARSIAEAE